MDNTYQYIWNEGKGKNNLIKRMVDAHRKRKRKRKIDKLKALDNHWKGLEGYDYK